MPKVNVPGLDKPVNFPDEMTTDQISHAIETDILPKLSQSQSPSGFESVRGSILGRLAQGIADPALGMIQLASHIPGADPSARLNTKSIDEQIAQNEQAYQLSRKSSGNDGVDIARFAGNVVSPVNMGIAKISPILGNTIAKRAATGAIAGGLSGVTNPITNTDSQNDFWTTKGIQTGVGSALGAILNPIVSSIGDKVAGFVGRKLSTPDASKNADAIITQALKENGQTDVPPSFVENIRAEVNNSLKEGRQLDVASLLRKKDFESLNLPATQGQITRDASQFAKEKNLRGIANAGEPLQNIFDTQNKVLTDKLSNISGNASEANQAGQKLADALRSTDQNISSQVRAAYKAARASSGRDLEVPMEGLSQDVAGVIKDYGKGNIPAAVRTRLGEFGIFDGKQTKLFTVNDAEELLQQINKVYDPMKKAEAGALDQLRGAIKNAVSSADDSGGVFAEARQMAAKRYSLQDAIPALKAVSEGSVNPDTFVNKYLINGRSDQVQMLAKLLKNTNPDAYQEARNQIGNRIYRSAFGENVTGDKLFRPEEFSKTLRAIGTDKLKAFFSPEEIEQLKTIGRVGAYVNSTPTSAPVNFSNTAGTAANLAQQALPGKASILASVLRSAKNVKDVNAAINPKIPSTAAPLSLSNAQRELLSRSLLFGSTGISGALIPRD